MSVKRENTNTKQPQNSPTVPPIRQRKDRDAARRPGFRAARYTEPRENGRGDSLSPNAEAKRQRRAGLEAAAGHPLSSRQVRRPRKEMQREQTQQARAARMLPMTDVLTGPPREAA